jgi:DNA-binding response OmpR family regulator
MRLLVIEDEISLAQSLKKILKTEGYAVDLAFNGRGGCDQALAEDYDLILLDLALPELSGQEIIQTLRQAKNSVPILVLTAKDALDDKVNCLTAGADDYLIKPFEVKELLARIQALLRRPKAVLGKSLNCGNLVLDLGAKTASRAGKNIPLTAKELALLEYLLRHQGKILNKQELIDHVWGADLDLFSRTVDVYIGYLRAKIDKAFPQEKPLIKTFKNLGYRLG